MNTLLKYISTTLLIFGLSAFWMGCDRTTDVFDGPGLVDRFGEFALVDSLKASTTDGVDFANGESVFFTASFNKRVDWILRITGQTSGAVKEIVGFDNELNVDNSTWNGGTTVLPFFVAENANVELIIPEADSLTLTTSVTTLSERVYEGMLVTDFEVDQSQHIEFGNFEFELSANTGRQNMIQAAQGEYYYLMEGTDGNLSNFFVGLINIKASITGETYIPLPTTVPEDLYFNSFLFADGGPYGIAVIQFATDSNDSGEYEDGPDQTFQVSGDYPVTWTGWQHVFHTMADIGMTEEDLQKLVAIRVLLISDMNSQPTPPLQVDFGIDYITFTSGAPLQL